MNDNKAGNVLAEYMRRIDNGEAVDVDAICQAHPEIEAELRSYISNEEMLNEMVSKKETSQVSAQQETLKPGQGQATDKQLVGKMFGRYKLVRQLGQGAMGAVFLARDTHLERDVALKTPTVSMTDREEFLERFKREAQAAAHLKHPNICPVHDFGEVDGVPFITMGLINGQPLSRLVIKENNDQRWIATIVRTIADALKHAHEQGVVHRDLKPGNILVEDNGTPYITDFGLAFRVDQADQSRLTQEGAILGTPLYMAPEQANSRTDEIGPATDIYALGVILYELMCGETPFRGSLGSILAQITRDDPQPPGEINSHCDKELSRLALKMMAKQPSERPASMGVVIAELDDFLAAPKSEPDIVDAQTQRNIDKLEATKKKIERLVERGQYAQAIRLLEIMAAITAPEAVGFANWARAELPRVKEIPKKKRDSLPAIVATAKKLIKKHDYGQAAEMLQQIPNNMRTAEVSELLDQAIELQDEVDLLLTALRECVRRKQFNGIEENLKRLLEIKPGNRFAKELWESLQTYSKVPYKSRNYNVDKKGRLLPKEDGIGKAVIGVIAFGAVVFGLMLYGITIYLKSGNETLAVTVDEEMLKNGEITLTFDGKDYVIDGPEFRLNIAPGEYGYEVRQGSTIVRNPETFTVVSDGRNVLEIGRRFATAATTSGQALPDESSWTPLFTTSSGTSAWQELGPFQEQNGLLIANKTGVAVTKDSYSDFELEFEWRIASGGNSGVYYRTNDQEVLDYAYRGRPYPGTEFQLLDNDRHKDGRSPLSSAGALYGVIPATEDATNPVGEWNTSRIVASGPNVEHWLNSQKVVSYQLGSASWNQALGKANYPQLRANASSRSGRIAIQGHTGEIAFREIRIRELDSKSAVNQISPAVNANESNLFNGRDLTGWREYESGSTNISGWQVRNGELTKSGPQVADIRTEKMYENFVLDFEWKVGKDANSGVYYRVPYGLSQPGQGALEYQVIDKDFSKSQLKPEQRAGTIYGVVFSNGVAEKPSGQWNTASIVARGNEIQHWLNGSLIASEYTNSATWKDKVSKISRFIAHPDVGQPKPGYIVLQGYEGDISYRNMKIKALDDNTSATSAPQQTTPAPSPSPTSKPVKPPVPDIVLGNVRAMKLKESYTKNPHVMNRSGNGFATYPEQTRGKSGDEMTVQVEGKMTGTNSAWGLSIPTQDPFVEVAVLVQGNKRLSLTEVRRSKPTKNHYVLDLKPVNGTRKLAVSIHGDVVLVYVNGERVARPIKVEHEMISHRISLASIGPGLAEFHNLVTGKVLP